MKEKEIKQVYETPEVWVYETKVKAVICQMSNEPLERENQDW